MDELSHLDKSGQATMVDISGKADTNRVAIARGQVTMKPETYEILKQGNMPKGDVLSTARIAGIMGAKHTYQFIPLCHPILISSIDVEVELDDANHQVLISASARSTGKTGVEMEALTAVSIAGLTIYDMCKAVDKGMKIENIRLVHKSGGKSGTVTLE